MSKENLVPSVGVVAIKDSGILIIREGENSGHLTGMYGLPSGRVNADETEQEAAAREFTEESGLTADTKDFKEFEGNYFVADIPRKDGTVSHFGWKVFKVSNFSGELKSNDETTPEWFEFKQIEELEQKMKLLPNILNAIKASLKSQ